MTAQKEPRLETSLIFEASRNLLKVLSEYTCTSVLWEGGTKGEKEEEVKEEGGRDGTFPKFTMVQAQPKEYCNRINEIIDTVDTEQQGHITWVTVFHIAQKSQWKWAGFQFW